jgi:hypothetical protein
MELLKIEQFENTITLSTLKHEDHLIVTVTDAEWNVEIDLNDEQIKELIHVCQQYLINKIKNTSIGT